MKSLSELIEDIAIAVTHDFRPTLLTQRQTAPQHSLLIGNETAAGNEGEPVYLADADRQRHEYLIGATGSGKTNLLLGLIDSDVARGRTVVVIDLRGDLVDRVISRLSALPADSKIADRLCVIDFRDESSVVGFNPLQGHGEIHSRAYHVLGVIQRQADGWGVQLDETLRNVLVALAEAGLSLLEIEPLLTQSTFRAAVLSQTTDPFVRSFFGRFDGLSPDRQTAWVLPVLNKITPLLAIPRIRRTLGSSWTLDVAKLLDSPGKIVLVALAVDRLHSAANLLGGLLVSAIQNAAMGRVDLPESSRNRVQLYLDEFETMASGAFESIVAEGRRFRLTLTLSHQNLSQLDAGLRQVIRNNVHTQLLFQTGALDASDLAAEVTDLGTREEVRNALIGLRTGEVALVRRGEPTLWVQTLLAREPNTNALAIEALRSASNSKYARSKAEVDLELANRISRIQNVVVKGQASAKGVRHGKKPGQI